MYFVGRIKIGYLILVGIFTLPLGLNAQPGKASISAVVVDQISGDPVGFASAALLVQESNAYVKGMQTVDDGKVLFTDVAPGVYTVRVTYVGYQDYVAENVKVAEGARVDLGNISLKRAG